MTKSILCYPFCLFMRVLHTVNLGLFLRLSHIPRRCWCFCPQSHQPCCRTYSRWFLSNLIQLGCWWILTRVNWGAHRTHRSCLRQCEARISFGVCRLRPSFWWCITYLLVSLATEGPSRRWLLASECCPLGVEGSWSISRCISLCCSLRHDWKLRRYLR